MTNWKISLFNRIHTSSFTVDVLANHVLVFAKKKSRCPKDHWTLKTCTFWGPYPCVIQVHSPFHWKSPRSLSLRVKSCDLYPRFAPFDRRELRKTWRFRSGFHTCEENPNGWTQISALEEDSSTKYRQVGSLNHYVLQVSWIYNLLKYTTSFMTLKFVIVYYRFHEFKICYNMLQVSWIYNLLKYTTSFMNLQFCYNILQVSWIYNLL